MSRQLSHDSSVFEEKHFPIVLILDAVSAPANVGSLFRLADAFNIEKILLCGPEIDLQTPRIQKTARSTIKTVSFEQRENSLETCLQLQEEGYELFALEITEDSVPIDSLSFEKIPKLALIVGNEVAGIDEDLLNLASKRLHINMFGKNSSMNVAQSAGIALYEITKTLPASE